MTTETQPTDAAEAPAAEAARDQEREPDWAGPDGELGLAILAKNKARLESYKEVPEDIKEHANQEIHLARGGYADRQIVELTQNSVDTLSMVGGRIEAVLTQESLYFADNGSPIDETDVTKLLQAHISDKGEDQIGRFGLGFKSLLRVSNKIEFISRSCSFRFDRAWSTHQILSIFPDMTEANLPMMRLAQPFDPKPEIQSDPILNGLVENHEKVIRVTIDSRNASSLSCQMSDFPSKFLLLKSHVASVVLDDRTRNESTTIRVERSADALQLIKDDSREEWHRFAVNHRLTDGAIEDRGGLAKSDSVEITWLVRKRAHDKPGRFWAHFPTQVPCPVWGIVNADWSTDSERSVVENRYNNELVGAAARLIADNVHMLATAEDPAAHLDALPRSSGSDEAKYTSDLRTTLFRELQTRRVVPDNKGQLATADRLKYPPRLRDQSFQNARDRWNESNHAPAGWLHPSAITSDDRLDAIARMIPGAQGLKSEIDTSRIATVSEWLGALTHGKVADDAVEAARDAIGVAVCLPENQRSSAYLGQIFRTRDDDWGSLGEVYLPSASDSDNVGDGKLIHDGLVEDRETLDALKELGVRELTGKEIFKRTLDWYQRRNPYPYRATPDDCIKLWQAASETKWRDVVRAVEEKQGYRSMIPVQVADGTWKPLKDTIWPGQVCKEDEARHICVDAQFHSGTHQDILECLGVMAGPLEDFDVKQEEGYTDYETKIRQKYRLRGHPTGRRPQEGSLRIRHPKSPGPLDILKRLQGKPRVRYTKALLECESLFNKCTVSHKTQDQYEPFDYPNFSLHFVREHGRVSDGRDGVVPLVKAGKHPSALRELAALPTWSKIKSAFDFDEPSLPTDECEAIDPGEEEPIFEVWPGLRSLNFVKDDGQALIRCDGISVRGVQDDRYPHFREGHRVYVAWSGARKGLKSVNDALGLGLSDAQISEVLQYEVRQIEPLRRTVRACKTDEERLLMAVGEQNLLGELPEDLIEFNRYSGDTLKGIKVAEAAIATWHSDALWHCRRHLKHLNPPENWAGARPILEFVASLGFGPEWARERTSRLPAYKDVRGPFKLNDLHDYQQLIVNEVRSMLRGGGVESSARRGLISLPTGAGKTRVTVQAVVEAMRDDAFGGNVLWVADREELCEQAIEHWEEVWRCIGPERRDLRISRLYAGRDAPIRTGDTHVIVASIQTLDRRLMHGGNEYDIVREVGLVVFDEAHHAIARSYRRLINDLGCNPRDAGRGPVLLGLTATPYRGRNEEETDRLASVFHHNRLDRKALEGIVADDPEDVIRYLQSPRMRILAKPDHEEIDAGDFELSGRELAQLEEDPYWLPSSAEERLAAKAERTEEILNAYEKYVGHRSERWPTLIFATSVRHAQTIAAVLCQRGVQARWVSADTQPQTRRRYVEEYREGKIEVLVNYGVFREGFDAPKTRAVIVARPVYSPNLYFQMIGRGLRGPENGGNENCLIIDVRDNIFQFEKQLAFTELDWLWQ